MTSKKYDFTPGHYSITAVVTVNNQIRNIKAVTVYSLTAEILKEHLDDYRGRLKLYKCKDIRLETVLSVDK